MEPRFLDVGEVLEIHLSQVETFGGPPGIRDMGLLESAIAMPRAGIRGTFVHGTLIEMAAAYLFHLARNHPFIDGNKRTALVSALVFLDLNGLRVSSTDDALAELVEDVAAGKIDKVGAATWFQDHSEPT